MNKTAAIFPVVLGIDFDGEAHLIGKDPANADRAAQLSRTLFGVREGLPRLLDMLEQHQLPATFFVPGYVVDNHPRNVQEIARRGHELGGHGYYHRAASLLRADEERKEIADGNKALEKITGERPLSWRAPSWEFSADTMKFLIEEGIRLSANCMDRYYPYFHQGTTPRNALLELPIQYYLADASYFAKRDCPPSEEVYAMWQKEFECLYEDQQDAYFHLTLHVELISRPGRLRGLTHLLETIQKHERTRFYRCRDILSAVEKGEISIA